MNDAVDRDFLVELVRRSPSLAALRAESMTRADLERQLDVSKSTSHRAVTTLVDRGLARKSDGEYELTEYGRAVADAVTGFEADVRASTRLAPIFEAVSGTDPPCPIDAFADATVTSTDRGDPFAPLARFVSLVRETDSLRMLDSYAIAPTYIDEIHGRVMDGLDTAVVERTDVTEDILANYPGKCVELCANEFFTMKVREDIPFGLAVLDDRVGVGVRNPETGTPWTFVDTDAQEAREWADAVFEGVEREAIELERYNPQGVKEAIESSSIASSSAPDQ